MAVVAQHYAGPPESLTTQVHSRVGRLAAVGWQIGEVILVSNGRTDVEATSARTVLARELLGHLRHMNGTRMILSVESQLGRRAAHSLTTLAAALHQYAFASRVVLSVRVGEQSAAESGMPRTARAG